MGPQLSSNVRIFTAPNAGQWRLTFEEKRRILLTYLRGADIDPNAVEVSQFSMLLKLIENESAESLQDFVTRLWEPALPPLDGINGPYYMVRARDEADISNHYLLAVLNHPLSEAFVRTNTSTFRGGYHSHGKQFIENLPIPIPDEEQQREIEGLVGTLIDTLDQLSAARTPRDRRRLEREAADLRNAIEDRLSTILGLSAEDMETVRAVPVPT